MAVLSFLARALALMGLTLVLCAWTAGAQIDVPSDPRASYFLLDLSRKSPANLVTITTKRIGPSGISFARRLVNCRNMTFRYTGDADTLEELRRQNLKGPMGPLVDGSISDVISRYACEHA